MNRQIFLTELEKQAECGCCNYWWRRHRLGCAVDAASRGYKTLLLEQYGYTKSTAVKPPNWCMAVYVHGTGKYKIGYRGTKRREAFYCVMRHMYAIPKILLLLITAGELSYIMALA